VTIFKSLEMNLGLLNPAELLTAFVDELLAIPNNYSDNLVDVPGDCPEFVLVLAWQPIAVSMPRLPDARNMSVLYYSYCARLN
jgi:hypothetical protein